MDSPEQQPAFGTVSRTNSALLSGLKSRGNHQTWQEFVERYRPLLVAYGERMGLKNAEAEDAAQQTLARFCAAYQEGKYDREKGRLRDWLFGIGRNEIRNIVRQLRRREVQVTDDSRYAGFFERLDDDNHWSASWDEDWRLAVMKQCLEEVRRTVDEKTVKSFELFAWKGLSAREVAEQLGMTENAVFLSKRRVLKQIRQLLPQMEEVW